MYEAHKGKAWLKKGEEIDVESQWNSNTDFFALIQQQKGITITTDIMIRSVRSTFQIFKGMNQTTFKPFHKAATLALSKVLRYLKRAFTKAHHPPPKKMLFFKCNKSLWSLHWQHWMGGGFFERWCLGLHKVILLLGKWKFYCCERQCPNYFCLRLQLSFMALCRRNCLL